MFDDVVNDGGKMDGLDVPAAELEDSAREGKLHEDSLCVREYTPSHMYCTYSALLPMAFLALASTVSRYLDLASIALSRRRFFPKDYHKKYEVFRSASMTSNSNTFRWA